MQGARTLRVGGSIAAATSRAHPACNDDFNAAEALLDAARSMVRELRMTPPALARAGLTINQDGSYTYVRFDGSPLVATDTFTYTLTDGDGDISTATLSSAWRGRSRAGAEAKAPGF